MGHRCTSVCCRKALLTEAFSFGEGGPLAVDEVIGIMFYLFPLIRQTSLRRLRSSATFSKGEGFGEITDARLSIDGTTIYITP